MPWEAFPDIEALVGYWLRTQIGGSRVYSSIPNNPTWPLVTVKRIGGIPRIETMLDSAHIQLDVWGNNKSEARDLADNMRRTLHAMQGQKFATASGAPDNGYVTAVTDSLGLTFLPDPTTGRDRYIVGVYVYAHR
jgi:hypothetical protein